MPTDVSSESLRESSGGMDSWRGLSTDGSSWRLELGETECGVG